LKKIPQQILKELRLKWGPALCMALGILLVSCSSGSSPGSLYPKAVSSADEISAIQNLRAIATAQAQLRAARGTFGDFDALVQAGFLDQRFSGTQPNLRGYRFTMKVTDSDFAVNADPQVTESQPTTGARFFYLDSSDNAVHVHGGQPASRTDPTL
jgi:hypothetical protein